MVVNPKEDDPVEAVMELTDGAVVDLVFDTAGNNVATNQGLKKLRTKIGGAGTLVLMGLFEHPELTFNASDFMRKAGRIVAEWDVSARCNSDSHYNSMLALLYR